MTKELYEELRKIEDWIFHIAIEIGELYESELGRSWALLYSYLEKVEVNDLE